ncbi:MAG: hypothetical protein KAH25_01515 [Bacteroidales bacterium]|nr:hypothetical protein [Bacteroidales bacterium]
MKGKTWLIIVVASLFICSGGAYLGYEMANNKIDIDKKSLTERVDDLFLGKDVIDDGQKIILQGEFTDNSEMHYQVSYGGFTIYELSKESGGFVKTITSSSNLDYKKPEKTWFSSSYFKEGGYYENNYRPSVQECFDNAFKFLLKGNENDRKDSYTPNTMTEIKNFPSGFYGEYHYIEQITHPSEYYTNQEGTGRVYTSSYELQYSKSKTFYELTANSNKIQKEILIHSGIGGGLGLVLTIILAFVLKSFKPKAGQSSSILKTKWKNIEDNTILTIESKSFGNHSASIVDNNELTKGIAQFTDNGKNLQLTFGDKEFYYKVEKVEQNKLELKNLSNGALSKLEKLGSNAYKVDEEKKEENASAQQSL